MYFIVKEWVIIQSSNEEITHPDWDTIEVIDKQKLQEVLIKSPFFKISNLENIIFSEIFVSPEREIQYIEISLKTALPRYNELKELWNMRSTSEDQEFQNMETKKVQLLTRRKQILDNQA